MGYSIYGLIFPEPNLNNIKKYKHVQEVYLNKGLCFIPMTDELYDEINNCEGKSIEGLDYLTDKIAGLVQDVSSSGEIGYIETNFFGGTGYQNGMVYKNCKCTLLQIKVANAINNVLKQLHIISDPDKDEFDTVGLGRARRNEDWLS